MSPAAGGASLPLAAGHAGCCCRSSCPREGAPAANAEGGCRKKNPAALAPDQLNN